MTVQPTPTWHLLPMCGLWAPACTLCCSILAPYWEQNFIWNRSSSNVSKVLLLCSSLCSPSVGLSWEPEVSHTFLSQDDILEVPLNAFCEGMWAVLYLTALSYCYYICLIFLTCFRSQSFRYLMQNNKGERGQNPLTSHLSSSQEVLIPHFHGDHVILCFVEATPPSQLQRRRC